MCLSRQAQSASLPTIWGLPPAQIRERRCIAWGDPFCECDYQLFQPRGLLKPLAGGALGAGAAFAMALLGPAAIPAATLWLVLPALGFLVGHLVELRLNNRANLRVADEMNEELRRALRENAEARREILDLNQRQRDWNRRLEEQTSESARMSEEIAGRLGEILSERSTVIRGEAHDIKNPLTVAWMLNRELLAGLAGDLAPAVRVKLAEQKAALSQMLDMLRELMRLAASSDPTVARLYPETVDVGKLEDSYRRRLQALVGNRSIRVSVLPLTREAPRTIVVDQMVLDRVIDNLMSNAVKYTERGSIVLELDGKPGFLTVKISDTGRGISEGDIERVFQPGGSDPVRRAAASHGLGLSVVVRLLDRIGGGLEVMSLPDQGSTFWAHFPIRPAVAAATAAEVVEPRAAPRGDPASRVVTIRRAG